MKFKNQFAKFWATGWGLGLLPKAPGTFGSLWGPVLFYVFRFQTQSFWLGFAPLVIALSIWAAHVAEKAWQKKDDQRIVIDEVAGMWVTYCFVRFTPEDLILGFLFFRFFDVLKLFPARLAQDRLKGGLGVVADDLVAGVQAGLLLLAVHYFVGWYYAATLNLGALNP